MEKTKHIELIKPHRHAGRDYPPGAKDCARAHGAPSLPPP